MIKIGAHVSIAGGVKNAPKNAHKINCDCFQMFTRSPRGGQRKEIDFDKFFSECKKYNFQVGKDYIIHSPYYINLASVDERIAKNSVRILRDELEIASQLKCPTVVTHLGSAGKQKRKEAQSRVAKNLKEIYKNYQGSAQLTLEIAAGSGNVMGIDLDEMGIYFQELDKNGINLGFCFDTCHAFATGYDLRTTEKIQSVFQEIDQKIGLEKLKCVHFNDSKTEFNSKKDRHEHISEGLIGEEGLREVLREVQKINLNVYLETNHDKIKKDLMKTRDMLKT